jgi:hypothetical protein
VLLNSNHIKGMILDPQRELCRRHKAAYSPPEPDSKLGIASNVKAGLVPLNGLRHPPDGGTCGWYIWAGKEVSEASDFFQPLHISHIAEWSAPVLPYLALPPGWRFLIADGYEDVSFDPTLLDV